MRCQVDAPDGCGSAMTSNSIPDSAPRRGRPTTCASDSASGNSCAIASLPTGITRRGRRSSTSRVRCRRHRAISSGDGTGSPPPLALPGKHRHTAAMYTRWRNASSSRPSCANQPNIVLPAVHANGLPAGPSRTPGAWPISITGDTTGSPVTTGPIISEQSRQPRSWVTWRFSWTRTDTGALCPIGVTPAPSGVDPSPQGVTPGHVQAAASSRHGRLSGVNTPPHEPLIHRVLGGNVLELKLHRLGIEDIDGGSVVKLELYEGDQ